MGANEERAQPEEPVRLSQDERDELRRKAMRRLIDRHPDTAVMESEDLAELVQNLELYQAELEVQNEELRQTQRELAQVRDRYRDLYEFAPVGYVCLDANSQIRQANLTVSRMSGRGRDLLIGKRVERLFAGPDRGVCFTLLRDVAAEGNERSAELRLDIASGDQLWVAVVVQREPDAAGGPGFRMTLSDITRRKLAEKSLRQANDRLEEKVAERTAKLAGLTSQLRALAAELTLSERRERQRMAKILHDHLQQLLAAARFRVTVLRRRGKEFVAEDCDYLDSLLDETIETSRSLTVDLSPPVLMGGDLSAALNWLANWMAEKHGLNVDLKVQADTPPVEEDVKILLFESARELLFNAVKHARVRSVHVTVQPTDEHSIQIVVSDSGPGFDPAAIRPAAQTDGGFGLFSIQERLALIGGRMEIDSARGEGSRFTLIAPVGLAEPETAGGQQITARSAANRQTAALLPRRGGTIRVLLADDHEIMREGLARLLSAEPDIEIIGHARDGQEAVELARQLEPDVILMDVSMPRLSGEQACRIIHDELPHIRIIGLSMFEQAERADDLRRAGADMYLTKSGPSADLIAAIRAAGTL